LTYILTYIIILIVKSYLVSLREWNRPTTSNDW